MSMMIFIQKLLSWQTDMELVQKILKDLGGTKIAKTIVPGTCISDKTDLPKTNWRHFLSDRVQKRNLVNFLSEKFLELAQSKLHDKNSIVDIWWL